MSTTLQLQDDTGAPITSESFGAIAGAANQQLKFKVKNIGDQDATSSIVSVNRLASNDGVDFATLALDNAGNPNTYSANDLSLGTITPGQTVVFWVKVSVPNGTTPAGNPRQFTIDLDYQGT